MSQRIRLLAKLRIEWVAMLFLCCPLGETCLRCEVSKSLSHQQHRKKGLRWTYATSSLVKLPVNAFLSSRHVRGHCAIISVSHSPDKKWLGILLHLCLIEWFVLFRSYQLKLRLT